jgi:CRISPR/Cas system-associated exonuclease Cas4 (RecB family)
MTVTTTKVSNYLFCKQYLILTRHGSNRKPSVLINELKVSFWNVISLKTDICRARIFRNRKRHFMISTLKFFLKYV